MESNNIFHKCQRCNRVLKTEKARQRGFGDFCWRLHNLEIHQKRKNLLDSYVPPEKKA